MERKLIYIIFLLAFAILTGCITQPAESGSDRPAEVTQSESADGMKVVGETIFLSQPNDMDIKGNYAFIGDNEAGLKIMDISNPNNPKIICKLRLFGQIFGVKTFGNYLCVCEFGDDKMKIFNVKNPRKTRLTGEVKIPEPRGIYDVDVDPESKTAYLATGKGFTAVDIGDTANPKITGSIDFHETNHVRFHRNHAYLGGREGMKIIDVHDKSKPMIVSSIDQKSVTGFCLAGDLLYVAGGSYLTIFNIKNPQNPLEMGKLNLWCVRSVDVVGKLAYAGSSDGFHIVNVENPANPTLVSTTKMEKDFNCGKTVVSNGYAFTTDIFKGLRVIDCKSPTEVKVVGSLSASKSPETTNSETKVVGTIPSSQPLDITINGKYAYISQMLNQKSVIYDISDKAKPKLIGNLCDLSGQRIKIVNKTAYVATSSTLGLFIVDVSQPASPSILGSIVTRAPMDVEVRDNIAYVADYDAGLKVIDVKNPSAPSIIAKLDCGAIARLVLKENYLIAVGNRDGLHVIDISNPSEPKSVSRFKGLFFGANVKIKGKYIFIVTAGSLQILDMSDPTSLKVASTLPMRMSGDIEIVGDYAYVTSGSEGLKKVDIKDPSKPVVVDTLNTGGNLKELALDGKDLYVSDDSGGISIISIE